MGGVLGERAVSGRAVLGYPTGCAGRTFRAVVRGRSISRVVFTVDGRRVRGTRRGSTWTLKINTRRYSAGAHRFAARVTFTRASRTRARTLRGRFLRCARVQAAPRFTG